MKFMMKGLINAVHKYRFVNRPAAFLSQKSKGNPSQYERNTDKNKRSKPMEADVIVGIAVLPGLAYLGYYLYHLYYDVKDEILVQQVYKEIEQVSNIEQIVGKYKEGLPSYTRDQVKKHNSVDSKIWVTYKEGVYDITHFVKIHPGGPQILKAGGASLEPFFSIYAIHQSEMVYTILEEQRIGNLAA